MPLLESPSVKKFSHEEKLREQVHTLIHQAIEEDEIFEKESFQDLTSALLVHEKAQAVARLDLKEDALIAGLCFMPWVFHKVDPSLQCDLLVQEGTYQKKGTAILEVRGSSRSILAAERTALNILQRMCGIALFTYRCLQEVKGTFVEILDTRKTCPGMRYMDKYAVHTAGGTNHRFSLKDAILIKDNHLRSYSFEKRIEEKQAILPLLEMLKKKAPTLTVEIEVKSIEEFHVAIGAKPQRILLDNMSCDLMKYCVEHCPEGCYLEASGNVSLANVKSVAQTGVHGISMGCLTHSVKALDISLNFRPLAIKGDTHHDKS